MKNLNAILEAARALVHQLELAGPAPAPIPGKPKRHKREPKPLVQRHATLLDQAPPVQPACKRNAVIRDGLIVVTYPDKAAYLAHPVPKDVFGFSGKAKEWRASLKWVRQNRPEILAQLGLN